MSKSNVLVVHVHDTGTGKGSYMYVYVLVCHEYICGYVPVESIDGGRIDIDRACKEALDRIIVKEDR